MFSQFYLEIAGICLKILESGEETGQEVPRSAKNIHKISQDEWQKLARTFNEFKIQISYKFPLDSLTLLITFMIYARFKRFFRFFL